MGSGHDGLDSKQNLAVGSVVFRRTGKTTLPVHVQYTAA